MACFGDNLSCFRDKLSNFRDNLSCFGDNSSNLRQFVMFGRQFCHVWETIYQIWRTICQIWEEICCKMCTACWEPGSQVPNFFHVPMKHILLYSKCKLFSKSWSQEKIRFLLYGNFRIKKITQWILFSINSYRCTLILVKSRIRQISIILLSTFFNLQFNKFVTIIFPSKKKKKYILFGQAICMIYIKTKTGWLLWLQTS